MTSQIELCFIWIVIECIGDRRKGKRRRMGAEVRGQLSAGPRVEYFRHSPNNEVYTQQSIYKTRYKNRAVVCGQTQQTKLLTVW